MIVGPNVDEMGQVLTFDGSKSKAGSAPLAGFEWDMGDGTQFFGPVYQYAYGVAGTYTVKLTVVDQAGQRNTATQSVQTTPVVNVTPPKAAIKGPEKAFISAWLALAVFVILTIITVGAPVIYYVAAGEKAQQTLNTWKDWPAVNNATVMVVLFVIFGVKLLGDGLGGLFGG